MEEKLIGKVTHYFGKPSVGIIELEDTLKVGDTIHIKGAHDDFTQEVKSMQIDYENIEKAGSGDVVGIKVTSRVHENDQVFKISD